ncbi:MAG: TolC family protein [Bryobacteraceae bacterium]
MRPSRGARTLACSVETHLDAALFRVCCNAAALWGRLATCGGLPIRPSRRTSEPRTIVSGLRLVKQALALLLCCFLAAPLTWAQHEQAIAPNRPKVPIFLRPYQAVSAPPIRLANSNRLDSLIRAGKLYLTAQDAIALAIENNINIEVARYTPIIDRWNVELYHAGGNLPGVPAGSAQVGAVAAGQGVQGSESAAGLSGAGGVQRGAAANATVTQIGPVTPVLDPVFQQSVDFSHLSNPRANYTNTGVYNLVSHSRVYDSSIGQGWLLGGQASLSFDESYLKENAATNFLNPSVSPVLSLSLNQNLLQGFGVALNARNITINERNLEMAPDQFKSTIIPIIANVLDLYYGLVADYEDVRAKQTALKVAQDFYANNKKQVQIGTLAPLDVTTAEAQVASSQEALVVAQTTLKQQENQLKDAISRTGLADPELAAAEIIPLDTIHVPKTDHLPPLNQLVATAMANRSDIILQKVGVENAKTSALGTANGVLPQLVAIANASNQGLAGVPVTTTFQGHTFTAEPYFVGGLGKATAQVFRRDFPSQSGGAFYHEALRNRTAQADYAIDQLGLRQTELQYHEAVNGVAVAVSNQVIALRQARAQYEAAVHNRILDQQLLTAEQKKFALGASTPYLVVTQESTLATAQSTEIAAEVAYSNATVAFSQTLGTTLQDNNVSLDAALSGKIPRKSSLPNPLPPAK